MFFTVVQIGLNAVAILGGIVGDAAFSPAFSQPVLRYMSAELSEQLSFILSFSLVTGMFILFADLTPKTHRYDCARSCRFAYHQPDALLPVRLHPAGVVLQRTGEHNLPCFSKLPMVRKDDITSDDIYAVVEAGALAGVL